MSEETARRLARSILTISIVLVTTGLILSILALIADDEHLGPFPHQFFNPLLTLTYGVVGTLVAARHPRNPIGWMFCATGFLSALSMLSAGYSLYDQHVLTTGSLPWAEVIYWLGVWISICTALLPVTFLLLLFPDGRLLSARWRAVAWAAGLGTAALTFSVAFHPGPLEDMGMPEPNPFGIPGGAGVMHTGTVAAPLLLVGILGSITSVVIRFRQASGIERAQVKWLAFAGMFVVAGNILGGIPYSIWPDDPLSQELSIIATDITLAGIVFAAGIAILRYRLWDIDILINRTLVIPLDRPEPSRPLRHHCWLIGRFVQYGQQLSRAILCHGRCRYVFSAASRTAPARRESAVIWRTRRSVCRDWPIGRTPGSGRRPAICSANHCRNRRGSPQTSLCRYYAKGRGKLHHGCEICPNSDSRQPSGNPAAGLPVRNYRPVDPGAAHSKRALFVE